VTRDDIVVIAQIAGAVAVFLSIGIAFAEVLKSHYARQPAGTPPQPSWIRRWVAHFGLASLAAAVICIATAIVVYRFGPVHSIKKNGEQQTTTSPSTPPTPTQSSGTETSEQHVTAVVVNRQGILFATVPAGETTLGCDRGALCGSADPSPHKFKTSSFLMMTTEVTNAEYAACVEQGECPAPQDSPNVALRDNRPVVLVDADEAARFCHSVRGRLPSPDEWEYAARFSAAAGEDLDAMAVYRSNSDGHVATVGSKQPNKIGLFDMLGDVAEWCVDGNNVFACDGSFKSPADEVVPYRRQPSGRGRVDVDIGFRCVIEQP
jgi:formylglycine-generating enzyme required for sulfatase activity